MLKPLILIAGTTTLGAALVMAHQPPVLRSGRLEQVTDRTISANGASVLDIHAAVASLTVETNQGNELIVHAVRSAKDPVSAEAKEWLNGSRIEVRRDGNRLIVDDIQPRKDRENLKLDNTKLELHVAAPRGLQLSVHVGAGMIDARGQHRSVTLKLGAGLVDTKLDLNSRDASTIDVGAGKIDMSVPRSAGLDLDANAGIGDIEGIPASRSTGRGMHFGDHRSARIGGGGTPVAVHVGAGSIHIDSAAKVTAVASGKLAATEPGDRDEDLDVPEVNVPKIDIPEIDIPEMDVPAIDFKDHDENGPGDLNHLDEILGPAIRRALQGAQRAIEVALPKAERELDRVGPEVERALRDARLSIKERREFNESIRRTVQDAMREARQAIHDALKDLRESLKEDQER